MWIAVLSDIHGNLAALLAVLRDLDQQRVDEILIGGDLAEGGRQPAEVLDLLMERKWPAVRGNADVLLLDAADGKVDANHPFFATAAWALERLGPHHLRYLRALPVAIRRAIPGARELLLVHATPWSVEEVVPPDAPEQVARRMLTEAHAEVVVYGHIHSAYQRRVDGRLLISAGGVSGSNDQDPRPAYSILSTGQEIAVEVRRVTYDVDKELAAIDQAGLPLSAGLRRWLRSGGPWPVCSQSSR